MENREKSSALKVFFSTGKKRKSAGFQQSQSLFFSRSLFHSLFFPQKEKLWKRFLSYKQELILAVISRILFCRVALPLCKDTSTLRMA